MELQHTIVTHYTGPIDVAATIISRIKLLEATVFTFLIIEFVYEFYH
jgi:hypothetical protein